MKVGALAASVLRDAYFQSVICKPVFTPELTCRRNYRSSPACSPGLSLRNMPLNMTSLV